MKPEDVCVFTCSVIMKEWLRKLDQMMDNVGYLDMNKSNVWSKQVEVDQKVVTIFSFKSIKWCKYSHYFNEQNDGAFNRSWRDKKPHMTYGKHIFHATTQFGCIL